MAKQYYKDANGVWQPIPNTSSYPTHVHGYISNDGKVGSIANRPLITGDGGVVQTGLFGSLSGQFCEGNDHRLNASRTNILHNWDFRNPVNQRNVSGLVSTAGYFLDRWLLVSGSVTINTGSIEVSAGGVIEQRIEGNLLALKPVVVSVLVGSTVYKGSGVFPSASGAVTFDLKSGEIIIGSATLNHASGYMVVQISPTAATSIVATKVELGTKVSSLASDPPMDWASELQKCQRFFYNAGYQPRFHGRVVATSTVAGCVMPLPVVMRIVPTISSELTTVYCNASELTGTYFSSLTMPGASLLFTVVTSSAMTLRTPVSGHFRATFDITLSADL